MLFNSLHYLIFFPLALVGYFLVPFRYRWALLLAASYYFYMSWRPEYGLLLLASTSIDYAAALLMERRPRQKRLWLVLTLASNLGLLGFFKYFGFFGRSLGSVAAWLGGDPDLVPAFDILLPVGISFYTFQSLSYTIDVYRGARKAETHFGYFALYVSFFPQLVAGPIERTDRLLPQLRREHAWDAQRALDGLKLMAWGYFKKLVIADRLAVFVNAVYAQPTDYNGLTLLLATVFFSFQIYCDFSGYSDIAIGSARMMGIGLMTNFRAPYLSRSIPEFWQRWHISLSTWFRDYVYLPLGGNRVSRVRWSANVLATFLLSGLWHGANWTFVVWGGLHGVLYLLTAAVADPVHRAWASLKSPLLRGAGQVAAVGLTYALVCVTWVFFRAPSLSDALYVLSAIGRDTFRPGAMQELRGDPSLEGFVAGFTRDDFLIAVGAILVLEAVQLAHLSGLVGIAQVRRWPLWLRWPLYYAVVIAILAFGVFSHQEFIYFQF